MSGPAINTRVRGAGKPRGRGALGVQEPRPVPAVTAIREKPLEGLGRAGHMQWAQWPVAHGDPRSQAGTWPAEVQVHGSVVPNPRDRRGGCTEQGPAGTEGAGPGVPECSAAASTSGVVRTEPPRLL